MLWLVPGIDELIPMIVEGRGDLMARAVEDFMSGVEVNPDDPSHVLGDLRCDYMEMVTLPESIGDLSIDGDLFLNNNELASLPDSFGGLTVGGTLFLTENNLASLPESFGTLAVGGDLHLNSNNLASLPESFGNITLGGVLFIGQNPVQGSISESELARSGQLTRLPHGYQQYTVKPRESD